jgi:phospholipid/cholesterol/gamma-HCH transport system substrate-binding protein
VALALATVVLAACSGGPDYADLPLPGSGVSGDTYRVTAVFDEALNLAQGAPVKVNGVPVGRVQTVTAKDFKAEVTMDLKTSTELRQGSQARLRYDTPLGELFVQITPSARGPVLHDGDALARKDTTTAPTVEDTLSSASLLVNGGGLGELKTITDELNTALGGREGTVRDTLDKTNAFLRIARQSTGDIDRLLRSLASTSKVLDHRRGTIDRALHQVVPVARVLRSNTDDLVRLLRATDSLSVRAGRVVGATKADLLQVLGELGPILDEVIETRSRLGPGLNDLVEAGDLFERTVPGDWIPFHGIIKLDKTEIPGMPGGGGGGGGPGGAPGLPDLPGLPGLPALPGGDGGGGGGVVPDLPGGLGRVSFRSMVGATQ